MNRISSYSERARSAIYGGGNYQQLNIDESANGPSNMTKQRRILFIALICSAGLLSIWFLTSGHGPNRRKPTPPLDVRLIVASMARNSDGSVRDDLSWINDPLISHIPIVAYDVSPIGLIEGARGETDPETLTFPERSSGRLEVIPSPNYKTLGEGPSYIQYIIDNYDRLPDIMMFVHGEPRAHNDDILEDMSIASRWRPDQAGYMSLNSRTYLVPGNGKTGPEDCSDDRFPQDRCYLKSGRKCNDAFAAMGFDMTDPQVGRGAPLSYCCAQFVTTRERIRRLPKKSWRMLLKYATDSPENPQDSENFGMGFGGCLEHTWHILMGEPLILPKELNVPQWRERIEESSSNDFSVVPGGRKFESKGALRLKPSW